MYPPFETLTIFPFVAVLTCVKFLFFLTTCLGLGDVGFPNVRITIWKEQNSQDCLRFHEMLKDPSPSDGATVFKDLFANHDPLHPQNQDLPEFQQHAPFADTREDSNEFNPFGGEEDINLQISDQLYPKDQDTPGLQEHSPVADTHEDSEEFKLFVDPPYPKDRDTPHLQEHSPVTDTYEDSEEFKLFVDSAIIDHDYFATSVPSDLHVAVF
ncbi:Protein of unknown function [Gryllus bimaculatus]|nr:Protein of unknown function [Gryllus bimaculatus]